jgi:hypothetical protein
LATIYRAREAGDSRDLNTHHPLALAILTTKQPQSFTASEKIFSDQFNRQSKSL